MLTFYSCFYHLSPFCCSGSPRHHIQPTLCSPYSVSQAFSVQVALDIRALTFSHLEGMNSVKSRDCMKPLSCPVDPNGVLCYLVSSNFISPKNRINGTSWQK